MSTVLAKEMFFPGTGGYLSNSFILEDVAAMLLKCTNCFNRFHVLNSFCKNSFYAKNETCPVIKQWRGEDNLNIQNKTPKTQESKRKLKDYGQIHINLSGHI